MFKDNKYEKYIFYRLKLIEENLLSLQKNKEDYSEKDYWWLFNRYNSQKDILYILITAHDNSYEIEKMNKYDEDKRGDTPKKSNKTTSNSGTS